MTDQPKKTTSSFSDVQGRAGHFNRSHLTRFKLILTNINTVIPLLAGILLVVTGLALVSITILGFIAPLWISAVLSLLGSISSMVGAFLIYQTVSIHGSFDTLINRAIRRVIDHQN